MTNCSNADGDPNRGGWYASNVNDPYDQNIACANQSSAPSACCGGSACYGQSCDTTFPSNTAGYCLCADGTLRYIDVDHNGGTCDLECAKETPRFDSAWDAAFQACRLANDRNAPACREGNKGAQLQHFILAAFAGTLLVLFVLTAVKGPSRRNERALRKLQVLTSDAR